MERQESESFSFAKTVRPRVDENASATFDLSALPFLAKHLVFRYLDMESLNKIRRASHSMNNFVLSHRNELVSYGVLSNVIIDQYEMRSFNVYDIKLYTPDVIKESIAFRHHKYMPDDYWHIVLKRGQSSFFRGFTDRFCKTRIQTLSICGFSLEEEEVDYLEELWAERKVIVDHVSFLNVNFSKTSAATVVRFLKIVKPIELSFTDSKNNAKLLLTKEFYSDFLPTLRMFYSNSCIEFKESQDVLPISPTVTTLPPKLFLTNERIFPIGILKEALHTWWRKEMKIEMWRLHIALEYEDSEVFANAIDLPNALTRGASAVYFPIANYSPLAFTQTSMFVRLHYDNHYDDTTKSVECCIQPRVLYNWNGLN